MTKGIMVGKVNVAGTRANPSGRTAILDPYPWGLEGSLSSEQVLPLWGRATADNVAFRQAYQYCDDEVAADGVAYALLSGEIQPSWALGIGYFPNRW